METKEPTQTEAAEETRVEPVHEVKNLRTRSKLYDIYCLEFRKRFGSLPVGRDDDEEALKFVSREYGLDKAIEIVAAYPNLEDDFLLKRGYPLRYLRDRINAILVAIAPAYTPAKKTGRSPLPMGDIQKAMAYGKTVGEARKELHLKPDGSDDWMVTPRHDKDGLIVYESMT